MRRKDKEAQFFDNLKKNKPLYDFCARVLNYKSGFESELRYLILASFISSDSLIDAQSCEDSIEMMSFVKNNIKLMDLDEKTEKEVLKYMNKGLKIAKRDLKEYTKCE